MSGVEAHCCMNVHARLKVADSKVLAAPKVAEIKVFGRSGAGQYHLDSSGQGVALKEEFFPIPVLKPVEWTYLNDLL